MLVITLIMVARPALAAPATPQTREPAGVPLAVSGDGIEGIDDPMSRVASLINEGQALFDTADFIGAIDRWTKAYASLPDAPDIHTARNLLTYQIAQAHIEAHAIDGQPTHLRKAERLLSRYIEGLAPEEAEARASADELRDDLRQRIATAPPPVVIAEAPPPPPPQLDVPRRRSRLMLAGGITLGAGGALLVGTLVAALEGQHIDRDGERAVMRGAEDAELHELLSRGTRANQAAIGTAVAGALLVTTGVALLITGRMRRGPLALAPSFGPGLVGMSFRTRF
ncbi:MAG TPA: hypothetical protein VGB85_27035 [Nannocystis sp.]